MAYKKQNLGMTGHGVAGGVNLWSYTTEDDAIAVVSAAGYVDNAKEMGMSVGDVIFIRGSTGGTGQRQCTAIDAATGAATFGALI